MTQIPTSTRRAPATAPQRRRRVLLAGGAIALVLAVLIGMVVSWAAGVGSGSPDGVGTSAEPGDRGLAAAGVVTDVTSVPASVLDQIGVGTAESAPTRIDAPRLVADGKPRVLYVGAEFCPFCAAERWPLVVALSRFGTWSDLGATRSASKDVYPDTQTLSFHGATFTSDVLSFTGVETTGNTPVDGSYPTLDRLTPTDEKIVQDYNKPPYTPAAGNIPFLDVGGLYVSAGSTYSPKVLQGRSRQKIAASLDDPQDPVAAAIGGSANVLTAVLCEATGGKPADVCSAAGVTRAAAAVAGAQPK